MSQNQAILEYISILLDIECSSADTLADGVIFAKLLLLIQNCRLDHTRINNAPDSWTTRLSNFKLVFKALQTYYQIEMKQKIECDSIDLVKLAKNADYQNIFKIFEMILGAFVNAANRQYFIEKILQLDENHKECLASLIQNIIHDPKQDTNQPEIAHNGYLIDKINEFEEENNQLRNQIVTAKDEIYNLKKQKKQLYQRIEYLEEEVSQLKANNLDVKLEAIGIIETEKQNSLVENLKEKLLSMSIEHEKQLIKHEEEIQIMRNAAGKVADLERTLEVYEERLETMNRKLNNSQKERSRLEEKGDEDSHFIERLEFQLKNALSKLNQLEYDKITNKLQADKINLRTTQMQSQIRKKLSTSGVESIRNSRNRLSDVCPEMEDTYKMKCEQLQQQISIHSRRVKQLEKELSRSKIKAERTEKLEIEKNKLEQILVDLSNSKNQQTKILAGALFQLRMRYKDLQDKYAPVVNQN